MQKSISHNGVVESIIGNTIKVRIVAFSACSSCGSRKACGMAESEDKMVEVVDNSNSYKVGEEVVVYFEQSIGTMAVLLAYVFPFLFLFITLIVSYSITKDELFSGILSLLSLLPYFIIIYLIRNKLKKRFDFKIEKLTIK